ncbi:MAG: dITP/XTP pyrophosphatase [Microgenomates group bacterium Gr01-1014_16]|nr:MAG: dITP/XTP pyrophosphatase [Microgenomates group bacterium Gr01-1014_16]
MKCLVFVTGNPYKFEVAKKSLAAIGYEVVQEKLETPEIQSTDVSEIASYSAKWAVEKLGKAVVLMDAGYYIEALNGFPGPFIKYINQWLSAQDILNLMKDKTNRKVIVKGALAFCEPGIEPVVFTSEWEGNISQIAVRTDKSDITSINEVFIPKGFDKVESEIAREEMVKYWSKSESYWKELIKYLSKE